MKPMTEENNCNLASNEEVKADTKEENLIDIFNINSKDLNLIVKDAQNCYEMVFEQIFLMMIYVRCLIENENFGSAFISRFKLIHLLFNNPNSEHSEETKVIQKEVVMMLDNNSGSNDIGYYLKSINSDLSKSLLTNMEQQKIVFAPIWTEELQMKKQFTYNYYTMYYGLWYPLTIFKMILNRKVEDKESVETIILNKIKHVISDKQKTTFSSENDLEIAKQLSKKSSGYSKEFFLQHARIELAKALGKWASDIFARITNPYYSKETAKKSWRTQENFEQWISIDYFPEQHPDKMQILLEKQRVMNLHRLNQLDDLLSSLKAKLIAKLGAEMKGYRTHTEESNLNNKSALADISVWYERYATGMFKKIDQIPKAIVTILQFDLNYFADFEDIEIIKAKQSAINLKENYETVKYRNDLIDFQRHIMPLRTARKSNFKKLKKNFEKVENYKPIFKRFDYNPGQELLNLNLEEIRAKSSPTKEANEILTFLVSIELFIDNDNPKDINDTELVYLMNMLKSNQAETVEELKLRANQIMLSWSIFKKNDKGLNIIFDWYEIEKMTNRFKQLPFFPISSANLSLVTAMILAQSSTENSVPYPYNSDFPLPLWINSLEAEPTIPENK